LGLLRRYSGSMEVTRNIVVVGASAGGVQALSTLLAALPADLPAAVFVVLHIPSHTASELHLVLHRVTGLNVVSARDGQAIEAGTVYVAPTDRHLMLAGDVVRVTRGPKECRVRPAIDVLFRSAATQHGARVIGVVLTGMLDDGTAGLWAIKDHLGIALVQDPHEAAFPSMAQSAIANVEVDLIAPIEELGREIIRRTAQIDVIAGQEISSGTRHVIESEIARNGNGLRSGVMDLGAVSKYTCPDCHGVLVQIEEGPIVRFRCHTGHAFSLQTLIAEVNESIDTGLWDTLRAVEERVMLLHQMADLARSAGAAQEADRLQAQARETEERLQPLRDLVLDPRFFGHDAKN
jgi:two-component system chemotaxis response regulator CheB